MSGAPYPGFSTVDPYPDALLTGPLRRHAQAQGEQGERIPDAEPMAQCLRTMWTDLVLDGGRLLGRPRGGVGFVTEITGERLAEWARAELPAWRHLTADGWAEAARLLAEWVRQRDAAALAGMPPDARRAAVISAEQRRAQRRAELERAQADAAAELAALDAEPAQVEPERPRPGGWLRRTTP